MTLYLAVHHRTHTPHGFAINRASITALGGPGIHGPDRHGTHAYVGPLGAKLACEVCDHMM